MNFLRFGFFAILSVFMTLSIFYLMTAKYEKVLPFFKAISVHHNSSKETPHHTSTKAVSKQKTYLKTTMVSTYHSTKRAPIKTVTTPSDVGFQLVFNNKVEAQEYFDKRDNASIFALLRLTKRLQLVSSELGHGYVYDDDPVSKKLTLGTIYRPSITVKEKIVFLYVFQVFIDLCHKHNITFFMYGGTLIGSYRHHGIVPWDDDVDVFVNSKQRYLLEDTISKEYPKFTVSTYKAFQWKFYHRVLSIYRSKKVRWPYIDIFFYDTNRTHVYDVTYGSKRSPIFEKGVIFPLQRRPFEGALLEGPHRADVLLNKMYNMAVCKTNGFSHKYERPSRWTKTVKCSELYKLFPFVMRNESVSVIEKLVDRGKIVNSFHMEKN